MDSIFHLIARAVDSNGIDPNHLNVTTTDPTIIAMSRKYCKVGTCPKSWQVIEYRPSIAGNVIYMVLFILLFGGQLFFGIRNKTWAFMSTILVGLFGEIVGYIGRILLNMNPFIENYFLTNLIPLTIAPALLTACIYMSLGRVIVAIGSENSRLKPKMYAYIFVGCDLLALVLQAIGGGMASTAKDHKGSMNGVHIMIAGLISQVITMAFFLMLWIDFILRTRRARLSGSLARTQPPLYEELRSTKIFSLFQWSLFIATILIFVRCIYRVAELWNGFTSSLANNQTTFMIFEGPMIIGAVALLTIFHPGRVFGDLWVPAGQGVRGGEKQLAEDAASSASLAGNQWPESSYSHV